MNPGKRAAVRRSPPGTVSSVPARGRSRNHRTCTGDVQNCIAAVARACDASHLPDHRPRQLRSRRKPRASSAWGCAGSDGSS
ncbi:hypothetical protein Rhow_003352 [Rhodococcus wratislaviensis]|uniref:Uncharacterized protein n=1 Tax=Rhodococcus wratislaviensis TaxID=44752 RepID=A0A402C7X9_RHOWR|nr:hypothetical protein Rhow_003352 [Rhodococcus wratislaviensis]